MSECLCVNCSSLTCQFDDYCICPQCAVCGTCGKHLVTCWGHDKLIPEHQYEPDMKNGYCYSNLIEKMSKDKDVYRKHILDKIKLWEELKKLFPKGISDLIFGWGLY